MKVLCTGGSGFIGTHLADSLLASGIELLNIDIAQPPKREHTKYWCECNILDFDRLCSLFNDFGPSHVVHLAARTTMEGKSLADFRDNTDGTANVLRATKETYSVDHVIVASSQHVRKPGSGIPRSDDDFVPHGLYGESKVITENLTREVDLACGWTIIRPTTIWGPYHPTLPYGLWKWMRKGLYLHPSNDPVVRSYGYVKNLAWQIREMMAIPLSVTNQKTFYLGDEPIRQVEWINAFSNALIHRDVITVPKILIHLLAYAGDALSLVKIKFPMDSARYFNLTTTNPVPITPAMDALGTPPYSLEAGVEETVSWLKQNGA
ncbi:MAG: NAD(P)-dependent oxidoreductase [Chloroflexota bacterium]